MNANTNIAEYLKLCAKRLSVLWLMIAIVFPVVLIFAKIATPVQYTLTGTLTVQSDVMGESISDQYNISELSRSAALTSIALIENSDTVRKALEDSKIKAANLADFKKRVSVRQINDSNVLEITVVFDSDGVLGETFMANLMKEADFAIREKFANSNPSFSGPVSDAGRITAINSPWLISFGVAFAAVGVKTDRNKKQTFFTQIKNMGVLYMNRATPIELDITDKESVVLSPAAYDVQDTL